jgi:hypothetical protein
LFIFVLMGSGGQPRLPRPAPCWSGIVDTHTNIPTVKLFAHADGDATHRHQDRWARAASLP